ncbi:cystic fibrosis transmembrane conductance regulator, partial [Elysia marginata]
MEVVVVVMEVVVVVVVAVVVVVVTVVAFRPNNRSHEKVPIFHSAWNKERERLSRGKQASLLRALFRAYGARFLLLGLFPLVDGFVKLGQPILLATFLDYFTLNSTTSSTEAWLYATGVVLCAVMLAITLHTYYFGASRIGMRIRVGLCSLMYGKCLRLNNKSFNESSVGQIVNLMSNDVS